MQPLHVALIGPGQWGRNILRTLTELGVRVTVVHRGNPETIQFLESTYPRHPHTEQLDTVLADESVQAVCIATPIATHEEITQAALKAGKHVFVEKPLSLDQKKIEQLYALAAEKNKVLFPGYIYLYDPAFVALQKRVRDKAVFVHTTWEKWGRFDDPVETNLLVHDLSVVISLLGEIKDFQVDKQTEHAIKLKLTHERGESVIEIDREKKEKVKVIEVDTAANEHLEVKGNVLTRIDGGEETIITDHSGVQSLQRELVTFLEDTKNGATNNKDRQLVDQKIANFLNESALI